MVHETGTHNIGIAYRATPRCLALYSRSLRRSNEFGVGPPLESQRSVRTLVRNMGSNAISIVTASRTPRDTRRGSGKLTNDTVNIIKLRATFPILCAGLIGPNIVSLRGLVSVVTIGPEGVFGIRNNKVTPKVPTGLYTVSLRGR